MFHLVCLVFWYTAGLREQAPEIPQQVLYTANLMLMTFDLPVIQGSSSHSTNAVQNLRRAEDWAEGSGEGECGGESEGKQLGWVGESGGQAAGL